MDIMIPAWVNGELVPVEKLDAHKQGLRHKAVSVFVVRDTQVLMQRRAMGKYHTPGLWTNTCCTHPGFDEDSATCAVRRLNEEMGVSGIDLQHRHVLEYRADVGNGLIEHELVDVYLARVDGELDVAPNPHEVMDVAWVEYRDLIDSVRHHPERYTPWLRIYLADYADVIFGSDLTASTQA
ncbi:MAG: isopentenyl-diphosphate Delta-isomerase [Paracoccaceae bacterium]